MFLATRSFGIAEVEVSGAGSVVEIFDDGTLAVGSNDAGTTARASINLTDGGRLRTGSGVTRINKTGSLLIDGGSFDVRGDLEVRGGTLTYISGGFGLVSGATVSLSESAFVSINASTSLNGGRRINISSSAFLTYSGTLNMGSTTDATISVTGARLFTNSSGSGDTRWGYNGGFADVSLEDNALVRLNSSLELAGDDVVGSRGKISVRSGSSLHLKDLRMATGMHGDAVINIMDAGSSLFQGVDSVLVVGSDVVGSSSVATLNLGVGGLFSMGTGGATINKTGVVNIEGGRFSVGGDVVMNDGVINLSGGVLDLNDHSINNFGGEMQFNFTGGILREVDTFGGDLHHEGGVFEVGSGGRNVSRVEGDYVMEDGAVLAFEFEIGKVNPFGGLSVLGDVYLEGTLEIFDDGSYAAAVGDSFFLIGAQGFSGSFDLVTLPEIDEEMRYDLIYTSDELILEINTNLAGDTNNDGVVDEIDLNNVMAHFGETFVFAGEDGDANHDGVTDLADLFLVRNNFGGSFDEKVSIPEPGSMLLLGAGMLFVGRRRLN